jgi:uncharacterized protein (TIGR00288 family)
VGQIQRDVTDADLLRMTDGKQRIALLIDADNASARNIDVILTALATHGNADVRLAYGDWKKTHLKGWATKLEAHQIEPVRQVAYTKGKNATDMAMVIGAMDLLRDKSVDAFALVSSDADFTPLVRRLRKAGHPVYGFGDQETPTPFRRACTEFEVVPGRAKQSKVKAMGKALKSPSALVTPAGDMQALCADPAFRLALRNAVSMTKAKSGWALLTRVRSEIDKHAFELQGCGKFGKLMEATGLFETRRFGPVVQVRVKPQT